MLKEKFLKEPTFSKEMRKIKTTKNGYQKDDLKQIRGIGPYIEKKLNEIGITSFFQIAKFNDVEINFVSQNIGPFPGRIKRDNWVRSARELIFNKESN